MRQAVRIDPLENRPLAALEEALDVAGRRRAAELDREQVPDGLASDEGPGHHLVVDGVWR
jgi:hypothetical protein